MAQGGERLGLGEPTAPRREPSPTTLPDEIDLRAVLRTLWRRKSVLIGTVITVTALSLLHVLQLPNLYTAEALVAIETQKRQVVEIEEVVPALAADFATIQTQVEILLARAMANKVIDRLRLVEDPEFNPELRPEKTGVLAYLDPLRYVAYLNPLRYVPREWIEMLRDGTNPSALSEDSEVNTLRAFVTEMFLSKLSVESVGRSYVIAIDYESENPSKAALIANTIADLYLIDQLEAKYEGTRRATAWLNERLADLRQQVIEAESAAEAYREKAGLVEGKGVTVASQELSELSTQVVVARAERAEAEARLSQLQQLLETPGGVESATEVFTSALVVSLRQQETELLRREAELSTRYGDRHPKMINVRAELRDLRTTMGREVDKIVNGRANEVAVARVREASLQEGMDKLRQEVAELNRAGVRLRELEREADANRAVYETFLSRIKETSEQESLQQPDARIVSEASVPIVPSYPRPVRTVGLAFVGSLFIGLLIIVLLEKLDSGFRSTNQIERLSGIPALGLVPTVRRKVGTASARYVLRKPTPAFTEAVRTVLAGLWLSDVDRPPKVVLITSSVPQEGKTVLAVSLARQMARSGKRSLLIDCDLRHPGLSALLGVPHESGLVDLLSAEKSLGEVVHKDEESGLQFIPAGSGAPNPPDLLGSQRLKDLLAALATHYDLVVLDSPPALIVSDARVLSPVADKTLFVVRWERTRREVALAGLRQMTDAGADVAGVVLARVNVRRHAKYGFVDSGLYSGHYKQYYIP